MNAAPSPPPLSVSQLVNTLKSLLETSLPLLWVEGEISNLSRPASGHLYFTLKDAGAQVRCAMFRPKASLLRLRPADGMKVMLRARITLYEARGDLQLVVEHMEDAGLGALQRAFEQLKQRLQAEGLFASEHKRPLPVLPRRIGIITSQSGAAVRDVLHVLAQRFPLIPLSVYPASVQGANAAAELIAALAQANGQAHHDARCDVLLLVRGGGSLEDLQAFNDEALARAIRASSIPVISGVGHETDFTIADFVADARAPTPSAAAALAVPDAVHLLSQLRQSQGYLLRQMNARLNAHSQHLDTLSRHLHNQHPRVRLQRMAERLSHFSQRLRYRQSLALSQPVQHLSRLQQRLEAQHPKHRLQKLNATLQSHAQSLRYAAQSQQEQHQAQLAQLGARLHVLSPLATLARGYSLLETPQGKLICQTSQLAPGQILSARLRDGVAYCSVQRVETSHAEMQKEPQATLF